MGFVRDVFDIVKEIYMWSTDFSCAANNIANGTLYQFIDLIFAYIRVNWHVKPQMYKVDSEHGRCFRQKQQLVDTESPEDVKKQNDLRFL